MTQRPTTTSRSSRWGLKGKLILSMLLVGSIPLFAGLLLAFLQGSKEIREVSGESFKALAIEASRKLDLLVAEEIARTSRIAADPAVVQALEQRRDWLQSLTKESRTAWVEAQRAQWEATAPTAGNAITNSPLSRLLREYSSGSRSAPDPVVPHVVRAATKLLYLTDVEGNLVGALTTLPPFANHDTAWWQGAFHKGVGRLYLEDLAFNERLQAHVFTISIPIMDSLRYEAIGVLHRVIDAKEFFSPSTHPIRFGKTGHVMLIDSRGIVLSCPILPTGVRLSDPALIPLVTPLEPGWVRAPSDGHGGTAASIIGFAALPETSRATNGSLERGGWHTFVWQSSEELFAPVTHLFTWMSVFGALALALLGGLGAFAAGRIVTPVRQLQAAARAIGRGEQTAALAIRTGDELEDLAEEITRMQAHLEQSFAGLASQVEQKSQEVQVLQQSTDRILDAVPAPIFLLDREARIHYMNRACRDAFARPEAVPQSTTLYDVLSLSPAAREQMARELRILGNGHAPGGPPVATDRPASTRDPLSPRLHPDSDPSRRELHVGPTVYRYDWFRLAAPAGEQARVGLVLRNATDESRLQAQWIEAEKSGSLGVLTAGIGHELNNPLFGIVGMAEAIQHEGNPEQVREFAKTIVQQGKRMAGIIRDFTGLTQSGPQEQTVAVDVSEQLDRAVALIQRSTAEWQIEVERAYGPAPRIRGVPAEIQHAFTNVVANAVQAMHGTGRLTLAVEAARDAIRVTIRDSGPGIPAHVLGKVFDPFFTTKGQGQGSGLGLTIARRLLQKNGGQIRLESPSGQGTTCIMTFPLSPSHPAPEVAL